MRRVLRNKAGGFQLQETWVLPELYGAADVKDGSAFGRKRLSGREGTTVGIDGTA